MNSTLSVALIGLSGVLVGTVISQGVAWRIARQQRRAEIDARVLSAALMLAGQQWRGHLDVALNGGKAAGVLESLPIYLAFAVEFVRLVVSGAPLTADAIHRINQQTHQLAAELAALEQRRG